MPAIQYPALRSEAEVQAGVYQAFKAAGYDPRLEVPCVLEWVENGVRKMKKGRFDVVVFQNRKPLCIIECKRTTNPSMMNGQLSRYSQFGVPVYMGWENNAEVLVDWVIKNQEKNLTSAPVVV